MIHQYKLNGYNVVIDVYSGAIHVVDDVAYDIIEMYPENSEEDIVKTILDRYGDREDVTEKDVRDCIGDVRKLVENHKLYTPDTFEPLAGEFKKRSGDVTPLRLH